MARKSTEDALGINSVEIAARILDALAATTAPVPLKVLADAAGMPAGKVHRYLTSLTRSGLAHQESVGGRYGIGPLAIRLGLAGLRHVDVVRCAGDAMPGLRDTTGESVALAVWANRGPTVVRIEESSQPVTMNVRAGSVLPVLSSAVGLAFLAWLPSEIAAPAVAAEGGDAAALDRLAPLLDEFRRHGLARSDGLVLAGVAALAAPLFDHEGRIAAVLGIVGRQAELDIAYDGSVARALLTAADAISTRLGHAA